MRGGDCRRSNNQYSVPWLDCAGCDGRRNPEPLARRLCASPPHIAEHIPGPNKLPPRRAPFPPAAQSSGVTTICFSRRLHEPRALASPDLRAAGGLTSAGTSVLGRRRLAQARELAMGTAFAPGGGGEVLPSALMSQAPFAAGTWHRFRPADLSSSLPLPRRRPRSAPDGLQLGHIPPGACVRPRASSCMEGWRGM